MHKTDLAHILPEEPNRQQLFSLFFKLFVAWKKRIPSKILHSVLFYLNKKKAVCLTFCVFLVFFFFSGRCQSTIFQIFFPV